MPRKHEELVYTFEELSDAAKKKALDYYRDLQHEHFDSRDLTDQFKSILKERGFTDRVEVGWSLGHCQGDGVAFWGRIDLKDFFKWASSGEHPEYTERMKGAVKFSPLAPHVGVVVTHSGRYYHWNSMEVELGYDEDELKHASGKPWRHGPKDWRPRDQKEVDLTGLIPEFQKYMEQWVKDTSKELEKNGYAELEYQSSDDYVKEFIEANDFEFYEDGSPFKKSRK
jgi:hypothetical protein